MERDMDTLRSLLLAISKAPKRVDSWELLQDKDDLSRSNPETIRILYHLQLLHYDGYIFGKRADFLNGDSKFYDIALTMKGHDFIDSTRDDDIWEKTKRGTQRAGGFTLDLAKDIAKGFIKKQVEELSGIKLV